MLTIDHVAAGYGRVDALHDILMEVKGGSIVGVLGPNGSGKTTLVKAISGLMPRTRGRIIYEGKSIERLRAEKRVKLGLIQVPQGRLLFPDLTVEENLQMGAYLKEARHKLDENFMKVHALFPILSERKRQLAGTLSGGEQQMLAIARALMSCPRFLTLDEPSLGLAPLVVDEIFSVVAKINAEDTTVLLAEQNARVVLRITRYCYVLENGRIVVEGRSSELLKDEKVRKSYLGMR
jgi:branched-chain amino acid transport system ATP-binding protein